ncbi:prion-inhibition and propagation-domain-containing protein, partial [Coniella lustricola]
TAVGLMSFAFQSFQTCVQAIEFFDTAQHIGTDGDLLQTGLEFERYRLLLWSDRVGLGQAEKHGVNWQLANSLLEQLVFSLTSASKLRERYSLEVDGETVTAEEGRRALAASAQVPKQGVRRLIDHLRPTIHTTAGSIIQSNNSAIKRLRWASRDKNKLQQYLAIIKKLIDNLEFLLDEADRKTDKNNYNRFLRDLVSLSHSTDEAGTIEQLLGQGSHESDVSEEAIRAAAHVKQVRLVLSADKREDEESSRSHRKAPGFMPTLRKLKYKNLQSCPGTELRRSGIELARYQNETVLIQWKIAEGTEWEKYKIQTKCLAVMLMSLDHESFRSLRCVGSFGKEDIGRHGIVFAVPQNSYDLELTTLQQLIATVSCANLARRLEIGRIIAEAVLQLHTGGWMHKSLRPENVVFLARKGSEPADILQSEPFLVGFEYARRDSPESAQAFTQLPEGHLAEDLYRHPQAQGVQRETYQKRFDMYALACILVELTAWKPL